jgi:hypothetical protein
MPRFKQPTTDQSSRFARAAPSKPPPLVIARSCGRGIVETRRSYVIDSPA